MWLSAGSVDETIGKVDSDLPFLAFCELSELE